MTWTCCCKADKTTFTSNPMSGKSLLLCAVHAMAHRDGYTFMVTPYEEDTCTTT